MSNIVHTKAGFRALRELCGLSQKDVANRLGCLIDTVKKWENEKYTQRIPSAAWDLLEETWSSVQALAAKAAEQAVAAVDSGEAASPIPVTYYRSQAQYDALGRDAGEVGQVDAIARLIALHLDQEGVDVEFFYP